MALFKISKGLKSNLPANYTEGYCYFTTDDGKFYIDTNNAASGRVCLNAEQADTVPHALISGGTTATNNLGKTWGAKGVSSGNRIYSKCCANLNNGQTTLKNGLIIAIKLPVAGNSSGYCISINNGNEYHPMVYNNNSIVTTHFNVNQMLLLMYDGDTSASVYGSSSGTAATSAANITGVWRVMNTYSDGNTVDQLRYSNTRVIAGTNGIYGYNLIALDNNNKWQGFVKSRSTGTTKTINTEAKFKLPINILYYGVGNNATNGNAVPNTYALYAAYPSIDLRYSHNYTTNFTVNTPVYLEGTIDNNGYFSVTSKCITQTLTSGNYYIFLGTSGNGTAYQLHLHTDHPVYYYNGTNLVDYTRKLYGSTLNISNNKVTLKNGLGEDLSTINYSTATTSIAGLMSAADKTKLDAITESADAVSFSRSLTSGTKVGTITINGTGTDLYAPTNTDTKVTQTVTASNTTYPLLLAPSNQTATTTTNTYFDSGVTLNPSTNTIAANISGNAATATKLTSSAGSTTQPIYFLDGKPVAITGNIANGTTGNAATATKFNSDRTIELTGHITGSATANGENGWSIATTIGQQVVTNAMLAGSIENSKLVNSKITIAGNEIGLGGAITAEALTASLGLSNAMHFIGVATVDITDGSTTNPVITNYDFTNKKKPGDVIIDKNSSLEYVWTYTNKWERLGIDSGYKVVQTAYADSDATTNGNSAVYVKSVTQNANGNITVQKATIANLTINNKTYNGSNAIDVGTIGVAYGGTGATTFASGQALIGSGTDAVTTRQILDSTTAYAVVSTSNKLVTERSVYFTLPNINNSHTYTSSTSIYAPTTGGTTGYYLKSAGTNATPVWTAFTSLTVKTQNLAGTQSTKATYTPSAATTATITGSDLFETYTFTESKTLTTSWQDTGIAGTDMAEGSYIIQLKTNDTASSGLAHYSEVYTGFLSWDSATTNNTDYDEIVLHKAGRASNGNNIYLRTTRKASNGYLTLQICCNKTCTTASEYTITARRLLT